MKSDISGVWMMNHKRFGILSFFFFLNKTRGVWAWGFTIMNFHFFPFSLSCLPIHIFNKHNPPDVICQVSLVYSTQLLPIRNLILILLSLSSLKSSSHLTSLLYLYMAPLHHYKTLSNYRNNPLLSRVFEKIIQVHWYNRRIVRQWDVPMWDSSKLPQHMVTSKAYRPVKGFEGGVV